LKLETKSNHQGTYTPQAGTEKGAGFFSVHLLPAASISTVTVIIFAGEKSRIGRHQGGGI